MDSHLDLWQDMGTLEIGDVFTISGQYEARPWWKRLWWRLRYWQAMPYTLKTYTILGMYPPESPSMIEYGPSERKASWIH